MRKFLVILFALCIFSCKEKTSHQDALKYYVMVQLQVKEVTNLVRTFSPQLAKFIRNDSSLKNTGRFNEIDSFKIGYLKLMKQINERLIVINESPVFTGGAMIKFWSENYIKDTRKFLVRTSKIISEKKYAANSDIRKKRFLWEFKYLEISLNLDGKWLEQFSKDYRKFHHITNSELSKYAL